MVPLIIAAAAVSALSSIRQGEQAEVQYNAQANANEYNAAVNRQRATTVRQIAGQRGDLTAAAYGMQEEAQRRGARLQTGSRIAAEAQSGTGMDGSNGDLERQSQMLAELDALNIRYAGQLEKHDILQQGELEAHDLETAGTLDSYNATVNRESASFARQQGYLGAAGALLSGGARMTSISGPGTGTPGYPGPAPRMYTPYSMYGSYQPAA